MQQQAPPQGYPDPNQPRSLNVKDALSYLDQVKAQFNNQPDVYNKFLDIMKDFKAQNIDTPGVIDRVSNLFRGHPTLVTGFNTFLPPGYRIEATMNPLDPIRVFTPAGLQPNNRRQPSVPPQSQMGPHAVAPYPVPQQPYYGQPQHHPQQQPNGPSLPLPQVGHGPMGVQPTQAPPMYHNGPAPYVMQNQPPLQQGQQLTHVQLGMQQSVGQQIQNVASTGPPGPPPQMPSGNQVETPKKGPVEFNQAISYVNKIKNRFINEPETYKQFLEILQTYQKDNKPIQEVYAQVQVLFKGAPDLLDEFKHFLPEVNSSGPPKAAGPTVRGVGANMPPMGNWSGNDARRGSATGSMPPVSAPQPPPKKGGGKRAGMFSSTPPSVAPMTGGPASYQPGIPPMQASTSAALPPPGVTQPVPQIPQHLPVQQQQQQPIQQQQQQQQAVQQQPIQQSAPPPKKQKKNVGGYIPGGPVVPGPGTNVPVFPGDAAPPQTAPSGNIEELEWIDRCKRAIGNKAAYNDFLKVLNMFSNEIIDAKTLVERVEPFLAKSPELFQWFKKFVKYDEEQVVYNFPASRPEFDIRTCRKSGHSYRKLPENYPRSVCSGRDDLCREVLNDDWISQPEYVSETGFVAHKKTIYEEALHKCEEERYEFDINIEANLHTIALLEPIYRRIQAMTPEEKSKLKLPVGLGGTSKTLYQKVIKKIYDTDKGLEVIDALHNNPAIAVPVVLKRLKQKDEEWKRCQRDWNKVWREIDLKNYHKALDHQGINFKSTDRKALSAKTLASEIENLYREQHERKRSGQVSMHYGFQSANNGTPFASTAYSRHQMDFAFRDPLLFKDARKLIMMQVGSTNAVSQSDEDRIGEFLKNFLKRFFFLDDARDSTASAAAANAGDGGDDDGYEDDDERSVANSGMEGDESSLGAGTAGNTKQAPLRKEVLLKQAAASSYASSSGGRDGISAMDVDGSSDGESTSEKVTATYVRPSQKREYYPFFANSSFYVFFRLYEILCDRLGKMKELSQQFSKNPPSYMSTLNPVAVSLGLQNADSLDAAQPKSKDRYTDFIRCVHELFESKIDSVEFEDRTRALFGTSAYISYTIDKLVQQIVKQIQVIVQDAASMDLVELYFRDRDKPVSTARQESIYRLNAERLCEDDNLYRLDYHLAPRILTFQLLGKDDPIILDGSSVEERWSIWIDQFIQLSTADNEITLMPRSVMLEHQRNGASKRRVEYFGSGEPFLRRSLPVPSSRDEAEQSGADGSVEGAKALTLDTVEMRSGLELKICLNTYKMFFVEDTEDYFARLKRRAGGVSSSSDDALVSEGGSGDGVGSGARRFVLGGGDSAQEHRRRRNAWDPAARRRENSKRMTKFDVWFRKRVDAIATDEAEWDVVERREATEKSETTLVTPESASNAVDGDGDVAMA
ncbi:Transcriptional regulatory protein sin3 [Entophlyctis sp. JEL0112]|nr:Transcriptional regulatory protein sin3 [Entophlyctis sp. JEL0112]